MEIVGGELIVRDLSARDLIVGELIVGEPVMGAELVVSAKLLVVCRKCIVVSGEIVRGKAVVDRAEPCGVADSVRETSMAGKGVRRKPMSGKGVAAESMSGKGMPTEGMAAHGMTGKGVAAKAVETTAANVRTAPEMGATAGVPATSAAATTAAPPGR